MIHCGACGSDNRPGRRFCGACGAALVLACPSCRFANEPDEQFCGGCGQRLALSAASPPEQAHPSPASLSPQTYSPRHLADKILASRAALEGERKHVTVLFADVKGSSELIRDLDTEDAQRLLDGLVWDNAPSHHDYDITDLDLAFVGLPPYSPELNPAERLFEEIRRRLRPGLRHLRRQGRRGPGVPGGARRRPAPHPPPLRLGLDQRRHCLAPSIA
jgi:hypothetical protein